ncbi:tat pathway signal sequence, partial [Tricladium varicosporioides]
PIYDLLDLELYTTQVNGSLFPPKNPSIARQMPNPKADAIWQDWEVVRFIPVSKAQIIRMGKDLSTVAKFEDKDWGLGDDAYVGDLDVFHQLHCLNSLRKIAYGKYYNKSTVDAHGTSLREIHVNHCVDILMQALMCSGNVNILTSHWVATQPLPFPDMSANRKCINFDKLQDWRNAHAVDLGTYLRVMRKPKGVKERPAPDALYEYHNWENPNHINGSNTDEDFNF